jgi:hypothetical protein
MSTLTEKVRRLSEMDLAELRFRISQRLRFKREQWKFAFQKGQFESTPWWHGWDPSDVVSAGLRDIINAGDGSRGASMLPGYFAERAAPVFFWDISDRRVLIAELREHFRPHVEKTIQSALAICDHRFRVFSYPEVQCGPEIPWRRDLVHRVDSSLEHHSRIATLDFRSVGDSKIVWEMSRFQHFFTLCEAYLLTDDDRFAEECLTQLEDWSNQNPYLRGINWASSLEVAFRSWSLLWVLYFLIGSYSLTGERIGGITEALRRNAQFIRENLSTYFAPNTHLIGEGFTLFVTGLLFPELRGAKEWRDLGQSVLIEEMLRQVREDGSHIEQSTFYHRYAIEFFLAAAILADRNRILFPPGYKKRLEKMVEYMVYTALPSGLHPSLGDSDGGRLIPFGIFNAEDHRPILSTAAIYFHNGELAVLGDLHEQSLWLLGPQAASQYASMHRVVPDVASRTFPDAGIVTMRSDWNSSAKFLLFDAGVQGPPLSGHGHADALSFVCSAQGNDWLVDPGTFVYSSAREWRDFFRSTPAHNTIAVDQQDQAVKIDWFKWRELPEVMLEKSISLSAIDYAIASHNGYERLAQPVMHRRHIAFVKPDYWFITDELSGHGQHRIEIFFHFAMETTLARLGDGWLATKGDGQFLLVPQAQGVQFRIVAGEISPIQGWYSKDYGHREAASVLVGEINAAMPAYFRWLLMPVEGSLPSLRSLGGGGVDVLTDHWMDRVHWKEVEKGTAGSYQRSATDAALAIVRTKHSIARDKVIILNGSSLMGEDGVIFSAAKRFDYFVAEWREGFAEINASPIQPFSLRSDQVRGASVNGKPAKYYEERNAIVFEGEF